MPNIGAPAGSLRPYLPKSPPGLRRRDATRRRPWCVAISRSFSVAWLAMFPRLGAGSAARATRMPRFQFTIHQTDGKARLGTIAMQRGDIRTPAFMPVGTAATVKAVKPADVRASGADILLGNTYHLMLRPTAERMDRLGGLHAFMGWDRPILTDSGGYQVMSLSELGKLSEEGVSFRSHLDGSKHMLTPERSIEIQTLLGSDIVMAFDQLIKTTEPREAQVEAMERSMRRAKRAPAALGSLP